MLAMPFFIKSVLHQNALFIRHNHEKPLIDLIKICRFFQQWIWAENKIGSNQQIWPDV